ncbi:BlaI/MecI/CopY family transcriptional regulator [Paucibacter sp. APW11]|uniref:BlaI/MecI/CopY family transcriptional regulator n=1 Tax=Roseateles aquae TaxID=3077235 RepID=A0ABU3PFZ5_9BURK|nr:BlaI/MecI/CopY family transcriptional regulator [Paucibacter sp. APW11]MDT9000856.1 BlaI/MecI/CopY family transcriptional regulator [Paucibacter sp. APW11]
MSSSSAPSTPAPTAPRKPTAAELDLLRTLWRIGPSDAKAVHEALLAERPEASYATVLRQLQIMHGKGLLSRDESQRPHVYACVQSQEAQQTHLLKDLIAKAFAGSGKALVMAALKTHVSKKEREEIQRFLHGEGKP